MRRALLPLALALGVATAGAAPPPTAPAVEIAYASVGPGTSEWPVSIATARGFFARHGLRVTTTYSGSPQNAMNALVGGDVNIVGLATDVVVAAAANHLPVKIVAPMMQVDPYALVTTASVPSWGALRGKTVMVTTKEDVTAITFRKMAEAQHLDGDRDFTLVIGTSTTVRYAALLSGNVAGAMLTQPWDYVAQNHGMHVLARAPDYVHDWLSNAYAVRTDWAAAHRSEVVRFIRAIRDANRFAADHPAEAIAILQRQTKTDAATAQHTYNDDFVAHRAFDPDERVDERALRNVIQAVAQHGDIPSVPPLSAIYDPSYSQEAAR